MRFHEPTQYQNQQTPMIAGYRFQGLVVLDPNVEEEDVVLSEAKADFPVIAVNYGEEIASARGMIQKFSWVGDATMSNSVAAGAIPPYTIVSFPPATSQVPTVLFTGSISPFKTAVQFVDPVTGATGVPRPFTYSAHYLNMFVGYRGGFRVKLFSNGDMADPLGMIQATHVSSVDAYNMIGSYPTGDLVKRLGGFISQTPTYERVQKGVAACEFSIPFYCPYKYVTTGRLSTTFDDVLDTTGSSNISNASCLLYIDDKAQGTPSGGTFKIFTAAGPDCSVSRFRRVPGLKLF